MCVFLYDQVVWDFLMFFAKQDGNELPQVERHLNLVIFGATRLGELSCCHSWRSEWPRQQVTWQRRRHSPPFFSCGSLGKNALLYCGSWSLRLPHITHICVGMCWLKTLFCTWLHGFLARVFWAAARHLSRVLPSNVSVVACPLLRAQGSPFPSVFATWPASLACHEQSEVFEPDIRSTCLWDSELNCHHALSSVDLTYVDIKVMIQGITATFQMRRHCSEAHDEPFFKPAIRKWGIKW